MGNVFLIKRVEAGSPGAKAGIKAGDKLLSVNNEIIKDVFDYQYQCENIQVSLRLEDSGGKEYECNIEKHEDMDLGLVFEEGLMDQYRRCSNNCMFCFIDQMPQGMRDTLYFKDDDSRLSFLQGNYITLTNMDEAEIDRIIKYNLAPVNISFHTMDPELRCRMLGNRFAGRALKLAERLRDAGIAINGQIVLCKGINDGSQLDYSLEELYKYLPQLQSLSIVPVGLTKYREGLPQLDSFDGRDAVQLIEKIEKWQRRALEEFGTHFVHLSDEWYIMADLPLPPEDSYDGYIQLENGVGMVRSLVEEYKEALEDYHLRYTGFFGKLFRGLSIKKEKILIATGVLVYPYIEEMMKSFMEYFPEKEIKVIPVENKFFGDKITVTGLLTGRDVLEALKAHPGYDRILLPENMFKAGERVFLDDYTLEEIKHTLQSKIGIVKSNGRNVVEKLLDKI